jgi:hypothetical protein
MGVVPATRVGWWPSSPRPPSNTSTEFAIGGGRKTPGATFAGEGAIGRFELMANDGRGGKVERHAPEVKARALELAADVGVDRASRELNLSANTIKSWQRRQAERALRELGRRQRLVAPVRGVSWASRRNELLSALGDLATESVAAARLSVQEGRSKAASEYSSVAARCLDKCMLLGGDPTSRSESRSMNVRVDATEMQSLQDEIRELEAEVAADREGRDG